MKSKDKYLFSLVFGLIIPVIAFLGSWWGSLLFTRNEHLIQIIAVTGLIAGIIINWLIKAFYKIDFFSFSNKILISTYLFYAVCMFGFFMGVPVFHPMLGILAGYYYGRKSLYLEKDPDNTKIKGKQLSVFTSLIMFLICFSSGTIALTDPYTTRDLQNIFQLSFSISRELLWLFIISGGIILVVFQFFVTYWSILLTIYFSKKANKNEKFQNKP